jgi:hypothetical protein
MYRRYGVKGGTVLDPSHGYGGRLVGWFASQLGGRYIGVDPNKPTHEGNRKMADTLFGAASKSVTLVNEPFEDSEQQRKIDFVFTSPPYFSKERYSEDATQSWVRYKEFDAWLDGFLKPLMMKSFLALKAGRHAVINIDDVKIGAKTYPLTQATEDIGKAAGFKLVEKLSIRFGTQLGSVLKNQETKNKDSHEPFFVFEKP